MVSFPDATQCMIGVMVSGCVMTDQMNMTVHYKTARFLSNVNTALWTRYVCLWAKTVPPIKTSPAQHINQLDAKTTPDATRRNRYVTM